MKKLLFTLGFASLLNATPSPITAEEIAHLQSTDVISATANISDQSRDFDQAVSEMWNNANMSEMQGDRAKCFWALSKPHTYCRALSRLGIGVANNEDRDNIKIEMNHLTCKYVEESENYNQQDINEFSFHGNEENVFKYHAIFNQTSDHLGADGKVPNFIAFFSLSYLLQEFKNELMKITDGVSLSENYSKPGFNSNPISGTHAIFGDLEAVSKDREILQKIVYSDEVEALHRERNLCVYMKHGIMSNMNEKEYYFGQKGISFHIPEYHSLIMKKLAGMFLKHLNIKHINIDGFSVEFLEFSNRFTDFPILIKALNQ